MRLYKGPLRPYQGVTSGADLAEFCQALTGPAAVPARGSATGGRGDASPPILEEGGNIPPIISENFASFLFRFIFIVNLDHFRKIVAQSRGLQVLVCVWGVIPSTGLMPYQQSQTRGGAPGRLSVCDVAGAGARKTTTWRPC